MIFSVALVSTALAAPIFVIDDGDEQMDDLVVALEDKGHIVSRSSDYGFVEYEFTGLEVDLDDFDVVFWMDGRFAAGFSMPDTGQEALLSYVQAGGGIVLFGQNGFNYTAGRHPILEPLIPLRNWPLVDAGTFSPTDETHPLCAGFSTDDELELEGGRLDLGSSAFGESLWVATDGGLIRQGAVAFEEEEGRGVQWSLWGNAGIDMWQTNWSDENVGMLLHNSVQWAGQGPPRPHAGGPYVAIAGEVVDLDGSASVARGEAGIEAYIWEVGDARWMTEDAVTPFETADLDGPMDIDVVLSVLDTNGRSRSDTTTLRLENAEPIIEDVACPETGLEGDTLAFSLDAIDPELADTLDASWWVLDVMAATGFEVELTFPQDGFYSVAARVEDDDGGTAEAACDGLLFIENVPPTIVGEPEELVDAGLGYVFTPSVDDPGVEDEHLWSVDGPDGLEVDPLTGVVLWTPALDDIGLHTVRLFVDDGRDIEVLDWAVTVRWPDADGDGVRLDTDCNDADDSVYPGAEEACDAVDSDCDGSLVDDFDDSDADDVPDCADDDADGDGYTRDVDCDDSSTAIFPGAEEACDDTDSDCDGSLVDGFADSDEDGMPDCVDTDSDGDGMSDGWEEDFGLDPDDDTDADSDLDGDGRTALEEFESDTDPTVYEGPGVPAAYSPEDGAEINAIPAQLVVVDADAPLDQPLTHSIVLAMDPTLETMVSGADDLLGLEDGVTGWTIDIELVENTWYFWTAWAEDEWTTGLAMEPSSFFVNLVNEPPGAPGINSPADGAAVDEILLVADVPADPDLDAVSIVFTLELSDGTAIESPPISGSEVTLSWAPSGVSVEDGEELCWYAVAVDEHGFEDGDLSDWADSVSEVSETACFVLDRTNLPPSAPELITPSTTLVESLTPTFVVQNGIDPEDAETTHRFQLDVVESFTSDALQETEIVSEPDGETAWTAGPVEENSRVWVRVRCSDGEQNSDWVTAEYFVSAENDAPSIPSLLNPADGVTFTDGMELTVVNSVDPEGQAVTYDFQILDLRDLVVASTSGVEQTEETTSWIPEMLEDGHYQWNARAVDTSGMASEWAEPRTLTVGSPDVVVEPSLGGTVDDEKAQGCSCGAAVKPKGFLVLFLGALVVVQRRKTPRC